MGDLIDQALAKSPFLNPKNTTFLILHKHEVLDHGNEILDALEEAKLSEEEVQDVLNGIDESQALFYRMFH